MQDAASRPMWLWGLITTVALSAGAGAQSADRPGDSPREQQADQQGAVSGEAPPAADQKARTPDSSAPDNDEAGRTAAPLSGRRAAQEHLDRIEAIVQEALRTTPAPKPAGNDTVGTTGTPPTAATGQTVTIDRAKLEELRMHLGQLRTALEAKPAGR